MGGCVRGRDERRGGQGVELVEDNSKLEDGKLTAKTSLGGRLDQRPHCAPKGQYPFSLQVEALSPKRWCLFYATTPSGGI